MWPLKSRSLRRPVIILGVSCSCVLLGFTIINKVLLDIPTQYLCPSVRFASYQILQKNEASKKLKQGHLTSFNVNFLNSNSPIEDRFVVGTSKNLGTSFFSVIDGHKGDNCSQYLQNHMLQHVSTALHEAGGIKGGSDLKILLGMKNTIFPQRADSEEAVSQVSNLNPEVIQQCLKKSLLSLDNYISSVALEDVKKIGKGHSLTPDMRKRILTAIDGACAITAVVKDTDVIVASTGDCRVVIGKEMSDKSWLAVPLSKDQNAQNEDEVKRLHSEHPGEEQTVIINNRVLGSLMPFRTFGDIDFKWEKKYLKGIVFQTWLNYETPPYVTAEPVVTKHKIDPDDKFMIIASDGLWERITNKEAIRVVAKTLKMRNCPPKKSFPSVLVSSVFGTKDKQEGCCYENAATNLLWHSLGGDDEKVTKLLNISPRLSRMYRDDITIIVIFFD